MQNFDIVRRSDVENTFRVASIRGTFDLQDANIKEIEQMDMHPHRASKRRK